jgi:hypothetical protein
MGTLYTCRLHPTQSYSSKVCFSQSPECTNGEKVSLSLHQASFPALGSAAADLWTLFVGLAKVHRMCIALLYVQNQRFLLLKQLGN